MNNRVNKIIKIIFVILVIILIAVLIMIKKINKSFIVDDVVEDNTEIKINNTLEKEKIRSTYYTVKKIVENYYYNLCNLNKTTKDVLIFGEDEDINMIEQEVAQEKEITKKKILDFFDKDYINETGLTINNLQEKLGNYSNLFVLIEDMYVREISTNLKVYFVFGNITEKETSVNQDFKLMIAIDSKAFTFNIYTLDYIEKYNLYELSKNADFNEKTFNKSSIEKRNYNKYQVKTVNDEEHAKELLKSYTQSIKYNNINYSYDRLDETYKNNKFKELSNYEEYINKNKQDITKTTLKYYKTNKKDDVKQYICVDENEKYYIFNETAIMEYSLILDIYTVDVEEFVNKYNNLEDDEKVLQNINKLVSATKDEDYKYVYSKLDKDFKTANFSTQEKFEEYIMDKYGENQDMEFSRYEKIGDVHIYEIETTKKDGNKTKAQIVMLLKEGTDFVFSFSAKN